MATEARPRADRHGIRQTLLQYILPEQAWHLVSCLRHAVLKPDGLGKKNEWYGPQSKICLNQLKSCGQPWVSTTKKSHSMWAKDCIQSPSAREITQVRN